MNQNRPRNLGEGSLRDITGSKFFIVGKYLWNSNYDVQFDDSGRVEPDVIMQTCENHIVCMVNTRTA